MFKEKIESMEDGKEKELLKILDGKAKPFMRICDGFAVKCEEDKEITYKEYNDQELTLKVPKDSYIVVDKDSHYPKIVTAEDFEKKNKFLEDKKEMPKKKEGIKLGINLMGENSDY